MNHITGNLEDFKIIKTRGVVQIHVEIPICMGEKFVRLFGFPDSGTSQPVVITKLEESD